jgi:adenosylcobinamide-phosphate guanylyltransferase
MGLIALVMAGGTGSRMTIPVEKPLLDVGDKPMIEHIVDAIKNAEKVDRIIVAVSRHTPRTASRARELSIEVFETPGLDFISDARYAVKSLRLKTVLIVSADLPFITGKLVDEIVENYYRCRKPALSVMVPKAVYDRLDLKPDLTLNIDGRVLVPVGINVIDGTRIDEGELEQEILVVENEELAVNVNTQEDLQMARRLFDEIGQDRSKLKFKYVVGS